MGVLIIVILQHIFRPVCRWSPTVDGPPWSFWTTNIRLGDAQLWRVWRLSGHANERIHVSTVTIWLWDQHRVRPMKTSK